MDDPIFFTGLLACILMFFCFMMTRRTTSLKKMKLPPGPPGWPIIGNLFQVTQSGKPFFQYVHDLIPKYGPIFTLQMGSTTMIIISNAELAHEVLIHRGTLFASRPRENPTRNIFSANKFTVNAALYGPVWRSLRRNMVQNMLSSSRLKEFFQVRNDAMDRLIQKLKSEADANNGLVWVLRNARFAVFCILLFMCFGIEMNEETVVTMDDMMKTILMTLLPRIDDFVPVLRPFFTKQQKEALQVRQKQIDLLVPLIEQRRAILMADGTQSSKYTFSYLDTLYDLKIDGRKDPPSDAEIVTLCSEFLNGGTDTTGTAIEWAIARLIENPEIQAKLYNEIRSVAGDDRKVDERDVDNMPYLQAVIKELLRKHPPTYLSLTHAAVEPTKLGGYDIPADCNIELYIPGISEDPRLWNDPEKFDPDRFFTGREVADITCVTGVKMIPFGAGRRICPGLAMATTHVSLMLARMVQEFEWSLDPSETGPIDFTGKLEFTVVMKNTLRAQIKPRELNQKRHHI